MDFGLTLQKDSYKQLLTARMTANDNVNAGCNDLFFNH